MNTLFKVAPTIATALGGPLAGTAVAALGEVFGVEKGEDQVSYKNAVEARLMASSPDDLLKLKEVESSFALKMAELGFNNIQELEKLAKEDRDSARRREVDLKDSTTKYLAYIVSAMFFLYIIVMCFTNIPPTSKEMLLMLGGVLGTGWTAVIGYYFGSSASSKEKNGMLVNKTIDK